VGGPETRDPAIAVGRVLPVTGDEVAAGRGVTVGPAHPGELVAVRVPGPVAADPLHVVPLGRLVGWLLGDRVGGRLGDERAGLGMEANGLGKRLMDGSAGPAFDA